MVHISKNAACNADPEAIALPVGFGTIEIELESMLRCSVLFTAEYNRSNAGGRTWSVMLAHLCFTAEHGFGSMILA